MDSFTAKQILLLYRPGSEDVGDAQFVEAVDQIAHDPELKGWFEDHCATYTAIRNHLRQIPVPPGLKLRILAEQPGESAPTWWRRPAWIIAAAGATFLVAALCLWLLRPEPVHPLDVYRSRMVRSVLRENVLGLLTRKETQIRAHFQQANAPSDYVLPDSLATLPLEGCGVLTWEGHRVSVLRFLADQQYLSLFIIRSSEIPQSLQVDKPEFLKINKLYTATWKNGRNTYLLTCADGDKLKELLRTAF